MQGQQQYGMVNNQMPMQPQYGQPQYVQQPQYIQQPQYMAQPQYPQQQPHVIVNLQQPPSGQLHAQPQQSESAHHEHGRRHVSSGPQEWSTGLCDCFDDMGICCFTWCCPCIQYGQNYEKVHNDGCCMQGTLFYCLMCCGMTCCIHSGLRSDIRQRHNLPEGCGDCLTTWCCGGLAICQEARELKRRG